MKNNIVKKKFIRCQSAFTRFSYSNVSNFLLEPTVSVTTTTQPSTNVVTTTGVTSSQDGVIPIASLFSSSDLGQPSKRSPTSFAPMKRAATFHQLEQDQEQTTR
jgi:hypothetical protein